MMQNVTNSAWGMGGGLKRILPVAETKVPLFSRPSLGAFSVIDVTYPSVSSSKMASNIDELLPDAGDTRTA